MAQAVNEPFAGLKVAIPFVAAIATLLTALTAFLGVIPSLGLFNQGDGRGGLIPGVGEIQKGQESSPPRPSRPVIYLSETSIPGRIGAIQTVAISVPTELGKFAPITVTVAGLDTATRWATKQIVVSG